MTSKQLQSLIYATAMQDGMPDNLCQLIVAQSRHETDDYTSNAFLKNNNCFGYKFVPGGYWQTGKGIGSSEAGSSYASYVDVPHSVHELTAWIKRRQFGKKFPVDLREIKTPLEYATLLKACGYYGDTIVNYTTGLNHFKNSDV